MRKYGQLVINRMSWLLSGALTRLVHDRACSQKIVVAPSCTAFSNKRIATLKMVGFFLLLGRSDQLVGSQMARAVFIRNSDPE